MFERETIMKHKSIILAIILISINTIVCGQSEITGVSIGASELELKWENWATNYILEYNSSLMNTDWEYCGDVLSTNSSFINEDVCQGFYRIRKVRVLEFPDDIFRQAIIDCIPSKFKPNDQIYDIDNIGSVSILNLRTAEGAYISNTDGIEYLSNLAVIRMSSDFATSLNFQPEPMRELYISSMHSLTNLNVHGSTNLYYLDFAYCPNITHIDLSTNPKLRYLQCSYSGLTSLDLSSNWLRSIDAANCYLTNIVGLSGQYSRYIILNDNELSGTLDVSHCSQLDFILCGNNNLTDLILDDTPVTIVDCRNNSITNISMVGLATNALGWSIIERFYCQNNRLSGTLDLSNMVSLQYLYARNNQLSEIILPQRPPYLDVDDDVVITIAGVPWP